VARVPGIFIFNYKKRRESLFIFGKSMARFITFLSFLHGLVVPQEVRIWPQHEVKVTLKLIQVYVTDNKGNPVKDLEKEDFIVYDNGLRQKITEFERHLLEFPAEIREEVVETPLPSREPLLSRQFSLFFDFAFNNLKGLEKAKQAALHFLDTQLRPTDKVGLLSFSSSGGLKLHEYLTEDHDKIRRLIEKIGPGEILGRAEDFEAQYWALVQKENPIDASSSGYVFDPWKEREQELEFLRKKRLESNFQVYYFIRKFSELAKALRYIPGHKNIILFSSGLPYSLVAGVPAPVKPKSKEEYETEGFSRERSLKGEEADRFESTHLSLLYEDMLKELSSANCTVYALDTYIPSGTFFESIQTRGAFSLQKMTSSTGGKYFGNINNFQQHIEKIQNLTGCYYVLGYYVDDTWDGKYHQIKVEVKRPGLKVYAQKGYFNPKPFKEYSEIEQRLHLVDLALSETPLFQIPLRFPMVAIPLFSQGKKTLSLWGRFEKEEIKEIAGHKVEMVAVLFDEKGNIFKMERREADLIKFPDGPIYLYSLFPLSPGKYKCRLVLRNLESGRGAVASCEVAVGESAKEKLVLYPPLLFKEEKEAFYFQIGRKSEEPPFDRKQYSPLMAEMEEETNVFYGLIWCYHPDLQNPAIKFGGNLLQYQVKTMTTIPVQISVLDWRQEGEVQSFLLRFQTDGLGSGEYLLYLIAAETTTQAESQVNISFKVKKKEH